MNRTENEAKRYQTFEALETYQTAREFRKAMYRVAKRLPEEEKFALASQIRRAAVSLTNNIAEGHGRFHYLEQIKFCLSRWRKSKCQSPTDGAFTNSLTVIFVFCGVGQPKVLHECKKPYRMTRSLAKTG